VSPWTAEEAKAWVEGATDKQAEVGAQVANEALARCTEEKGDDCEGSAIRQAKAVMGKLKESGPFGERLASALIEAATKEAVHDSRDLAEVVDALTVGTRAVFVETSGAAVPVESE
jgi:hypothetical protein